MTKNKGNDNSVKCLMEEFSKKKKDLVLISAFVIYPMIKNELKKWQAISVRDSRAIVRDILNAEAVLMSGDSVSKKVRESAQKFFENPLYFLLLFSVRSVVGNNIEAEELLVDVFEMYRGDRIYLDASETFEIHRRMLHVNILLNFLQYTQKQASEKASISQSQVKRYMDVWTGKDSVTYDLYEDIRERANTSIDKLKKEQNGCLFVRKNERSSEYYVVKTDGKLSNGKLKCETIRESEIEQIVNKYTVDSEEASFDETTNKHNLLDVLGVDNIENFS